MFDFRGCCFKTLLQASEYREKDKQVVWALKKFQGQDDHAIMLRVTIPNLEKTRRREFGPIRITFEIPMLNCSRLVVRYLRILNVRSRLIPDHCDEMNKWLLTQFLCCF